MVRLDRLTPGCLCGLLLAASSSVALGDTYRVTIDPSVAEGPVTGRVILFFTTPSLERWESISPLDAPFYKSPQPIASVGVVNLAPGESVTLDGNSLSFPHSLDLLDGPAVVQAVLDVDQTERSILDGPGNGYSDPQRIELSADRDDAFSIVISNPVTKRTLPPSRKNLVWVSLRSDMLSEHAGRDVFHRAGVALPKGYDDPGHPRQVWPVVFVIPGFGGREDSASNYALMLQIGLPEFTPQAIYIVLDPEAPLGHHGFADSASNGPRGTAFVEEFLPHLEQQFRIDPRPEARILYGHSSGGWSALWLQLQWPEIFGGCWSSAPDPVDFSAFQMTNLYRDRNLYAYAPENETPSYRAVDLEGRDIVHMTVREEATMEYVIDPDGRSGQQWDAWEAMFSPCDPETGLPQPMFDPLTGRIHQHVVAHWRHYDITLNVRNEWDRLGPVLRDKVRVLCGENDSFYLDRAVARFRELVELRSEGEADGPGYVEIVPYANHSNLVDLTTDRVHTEMIEHLRRNDLHD